MILNSGLDAACTSPASAGSGSSPNQSYPVFCQFIQYAAFGTGSTEPSAEQTTLDAQVGSRTLDRGGFSNSENAGLDAENNLIWYEATFTRVFNITSAVNATEWGLSAQSTGNLSVRDLFREDPNNPASDPVPISLDEGDQLQLVITLRVEAVWEYQSKSFVITGTAGNDAAGTHDGQATVTSGSDSSSLGIARALSTCWPGGALSGFTNLFAMLTDQSGKGRNEHLAGTSSSATPVAESYTPGAFYRDWVTTFATSQANGDHYAWQVGNSQYGYRFLLTNPVKLTKSSTHRLSLVFRKAVARL